jgi:hypothetical protein
MPNFGKWHRRLVKAVMSGVGHSGQFFVVRVTSGCLLTTVQLRNHTIGHSSAKGFRKGYSNLKPKINQNFR